MEKETQAPAEQEIKTYEIGFLLTPLIPEDGIAAVMDKTVKKILGRYEVKMVSEDSPKMIPLAYTIRKRIENKNQVFRDAYFGAVRFMASPSDLPEITTELKKANEIIRFLAVVLPKGFNEVPVRRGSQSVASKTLPEGENLEATITAGDEEASESKEEVIDREIDGLLTAAPTDQQ